MAEVCKKTWPAYFEMVLNGTKTFDFRLADFDCQPGDMLVLQEWDPKTKQYTGRELRKEVTSVIKQKDLEVWPAAQVRKHGYYIISFKPGDAEPARQRVRDIAAGIKPFDELEREHRADVLGWIDSGAPLFRIERPDKPFKHLVAYTVLYDELRGRIMLVDHAKAKAWLPAGGHVEPNEDPKDTALREAAEELGIDAKFTSKFGDRPFFVTVTTTRGYGEHTDVSLWYIIRGDSAAAISYTDTDGARAHKWFTPEEILATNACRLDPHLHRFTKKLTKNKS